MEPCLVPKTNLLESIAIAAAHPCVLPSMSDITVENPSLLPRRDAAMASLTRAAGPTALKRTGASPASTCECTVSGDVASSTALHSSARALW
eukprot:CAMPEP_0114232528 /NCGR_PEP_ID=MMETSP0058-20121206/4657_1 /TAXON_ID=36894 /ORGANISM="Pyramimonas parkeae, CCMP726" /LENGTH=91 /DNA_ID=CAMNT_0001344013 /DNA_START=29 /DNA_END=304 /DNA_ORIENTATION=-